jgi:hypothetical protein
VLDINTAEKSNSNKGLRKAVVPSHKISYDSVFFSFQHMKTDDKLPFNVLDELSREEEIDWKG